MRLCTMHDSVSELSWTSSVGRTVGSQMAALAAPKNPLFIEELLHSIFEYLTSYSDLIACYHVCSLWRRLTPPYIVRLRPPVLVGQETALTYTQTLQYLCSVGADGRPQDHNHDYNHGRGNPALKSSRFVLIEANPWTSVMRTLFKEHTHAPGIKQLELFYGLYIGTHRRDLSTRQLEWVLRRSAPCLETLIITMLPQSLLQKSIFQHESESSEPTTSLPLKKIEFQLNYLVDNGRLGYSTEFLDSLFAACPKLESLSIQGTSRLSIEGHGHTEDVHSVGYEIMDAMERAGRVGQLKELHIYWANHDLIEWLADDSDERQRAMPKLEVLTVEYVQYCCPIQGPLLRGNVLRNCGNASSLKYLSLPDYRTRSSRLLGGTCPLPRLEQLYLTKSHSHVIDVNVYEDDGRGPPLPFATQFPRLRTIALAGLASNYREDELFPEGEVVPATSVRTLDAIPLGVDRVLMRRLTRLFPSLTVIRSPIPYGSEELLISVWEGCPNLTKLYLALDTDTNEVVDGGDQPPDPQFGKLDSIFSGIPVHECERLRENSTCGQLEAQDAAAGPSLADLKGLRQLVIEGPVLQRLSSDPEGPTPPRTDRLSNVVGYTTFARLSRELVFLQVSAGLHNISSNCVEHICGSTGLEHQQLVEATHEVLRLAKPRFGYETMDAKLPPDWHGGRLEPTSAAVRVDDVLNFVRLKALSSTPTPALAQRNLDKRDVLKVAQTKSINGEQRPSASLRRPRWRRRLQKKTILKCCAIF